MIGKLGRDDKYQRTRCLPCCFLSERIYQRTGRLTSFCFFVKSILFFCFREKEGVPVLLVSYFSTLKFRLQFSSPRLLTLFTLGFSKIKPLVESSAIFQNLLCLLPSFILELSPKFKICTSSWSVVSFHTSQITSSNIFVKTFNF